MSSCASLPNTPTEYFCIAPFQSIRQNAYGRNSPCAFGAGEWRHGDLTPAQRWDSVELNALRQEFIDGKQPDACKRCWDEEKSGKKSLRQRQFEYFPNDYNDFILTDKWQAGPKTAVFKTSNVCNLACRSCAGWDTNSYTKEGRFYADKYNTTSEVQGKVTKHNRFIPLLPPKHMDFMQYKDIAANLEKIDFFGGEPLLNTTQLDLLEYLTETGLSKNITLFYSTNCTNKPTERLKRAWSKFKRLELSMSVDGLGSKFEYLRYPGIWSEAEENIHGMVNLKNTLDCDVYTMGGLTISAMNCYDVDEVYSWMKTVMGDVYVNMVQSPDYLAVHILPETVKQAIREHTKHQETLGYLDISPSNPKNFSEFIMWMKRQDSYRNQSFAKTFPEYFEHLQQYWLTDKENGAIIL
jgi:sulfatase maturation enzyme AslB (radical SAM superfamily)